MKMPTTMLNELTKASAYDGGVLIRKFLKSMVFT